MTKVTDLTGQQFERLTVIRRHPQSNARHQAQWECKCNCKEGNIVLVPTTSLTRMITRSCGCLRKEIASNQSTKHGMRNTAEYSVWSGIKNRCYNEKEKSYLDYGGRGIVMCDEWKDSFEAFYRDMSLRPSSVHTIERNDNDKGYSKENCHWSTRKEQANNRRTSLYYELNGESKTLQEWCDELDLKYSTLYARLKRGIVFEEAIQFVEYKAITFDQTTLSLKDWCELLDLNYGEIYLKLLRGISFSDIVRE